MQITPVVPSVYWTPVAETGHKHNESKKAFQREDEEVHPEKKVAGKRLMLAPELTVATEPSSNLWLFFFFFCNRKRVTLCWPLADCRLSPWWRVWVQKKGRPQKVRSKISVADRLSDFQARWLTLLCVGRGQSVPGESGVRTEGWVKAHFQCRHQRRGGCGRKCC